MSISGTVRDSKGPKIAGVSALHRFVSDKEDNLCITPPSPQPEWAYVFRLQYHPFDLESSASLD